MPASPGGKDGHRMVRGGHQIRASLTSTGLLFGAARRKGIMLYIALILAFLIGVTWGWGICSCLSVSKRSDECAECRAKSAERKGLRVTA